MNMSLSQNDVSSIIVIKCKLGNKILMFQKTEPFISSTVQNIENIILKLLFNL